MSTDSYHKRKLGNRVLQPETQMMGYGYDPALSEGSLKPPIFLTSTFVFRTRRMARTSSTTPRAAANRHRARPRAWSIRASIIPISKCSKIGSVFGKAARARRCSRAACRRSRPRCGPISSPATCCS